VFFWVTHKISELARKIWVATSKSPRPTEYMRSVKLGMVGPRSRVLLYSYRHIWAQMKATFSRCTELLKTLELDGSIFWGRLFHVETCMNC
jgi:hypothetical protein